MTLAQRIKKMKTVTYTAPKAKKVVQVKVRPKPKKATPAQYGDKNYNPSRGNKSVTKNK